MVVFPSILGKRKEEQEDRQVISPECILFSPDLLEKNALLELTNDSVSRWSNYRVSDCRAKRDNYEARLNEWAHIRPNSVYSLGSYFANKIENYFAKLNGLWGEWLNPNSTTTRRGNSLSESVVYYLIFYPHLLSRFDYRFSNVD